MKHFLRPFRAVKVRIPGNLFVIGGFLAIGLFSGGGSAPLHAQSLQLTDVLNEPNLLLLHSKSQGFLGIDVGPDGVSAAGAKLCAPHTADDSRSREHKLTLRINLLGKKGDRLDASILRGRLDVKALRNRDCVK